MPSCCELISRVSEISFTPRNVIPLEVEFLKGVLLSKTIVISNSDIILAILVTPSVSPVVMANIFVLNISSVILEGSKLDIVGAEDFPGNSSNTYCKEVFKYQKKKKGSTNIP